MNNASPTTAHATRSTLRAFARVKSYRRDRRRADAPPQHRSAGDRERADRSGDSGDRELVACEHRDDDHRSADDRQHTSSEREFRSACSALDDQERPRTEGDDDRDQRLVRHPQLARTEHRQRPLRVAREQAIQQHQIRRRQEPPRRDHADDQ
jgi:hypothetical protein